MNIGSTIDDRMLVGIAIGTYTVTAWFIGRFRQGRYITFQLAEAAIPRALFAEILRGLAPLPGGPDASGSKPVMVASCKLYLDDARGYYESGAVICRSVDFTTQLYGTCALPAVSGISLSGRIAPSQCELVAGPGSHRPTSPIKSGPRPIVTAQGRVRVRIPIVLP